MDLVKMQKDFSDMGVRSKGMIEEVMMERFENMRRSINTNYEFATKAAKSYENMFKWKVLVVCV